MYSELISSSIAEGGPYASRTAYVKLLRYVAARRLYFLTFEDRWDDRLRIVDCYRFSFGINYLLGNVVAHVLITGDAGQ